jgi:hypothetical protein
MTIASAVNNEDRIRLFIKMLRTLCCGNKISLHFFVQKGDVMKPKKYVMKSPVAIKVAQDCYWQTGFMGTMFSTYIFLPVFHKLFLLVRSLRPVEGSVTSFFHFVTFK